jgi:YVTN family beta-propeller protein
VDVQLNGIADTRLYVGDSDGSIVVMNAKTGKVLASYTTSGIGPGSIVAGGDAWVAALQNRGGISCIDLVSGKEAKVAAKTLGINPFMAVASGDQNRIYVSNQGSNSVSVLSGGGCAKSVVKTIAVGNAPRHMALSPDNMFLYVSNSTDNTISVISTASLSVVATIDVATSDPAPIGHVVVSNNNRYVYVFYEGGPRSALGTFQFIGYNVEALY